MLSFQEYRIYGQDRARYIDDNFSLLRSKIRAQHPAHRASLRALLRHLLLVSSHSDKNKMTVGVLALYFSFPVSRKAQILNDSGPVYVKDLILEDLIQNANTLFDERPLRSPPVPSSDVPESPSTPTLTSLFLSPLLGLPSSQTLKEGAETSTGEKVIPKARGTKDMETMSNSIQAPPEVSAKVTPTSVAEWRLQVPSRLPPQPAIPQSPSESVLSSLSDFPLSSATSLQTRMA